MPKPELNGFGATFAECEFRHSEAYSRLLEVLGYNDEFNNVIEIPAIRERIDYLNTVLANAKSTNHKEYVSSLLLFSILIENVSLFSQFATILSFTRFKGYMKNVSNIIAWTSVDEQIHANAGIYLINKIREEQPELLTDADIEDIYGLVDRSVETGSENSRLDFRSGRDRHVLKRRLAELYEIQSRRFFEKNWHENPLQRNP